MKTTHVLLVCGLMAAVACTKSGSDQLTLKIASVSGNVVPIGASLAVTLDFTEKGNVIDSIYMIKLRINQDSTATIRDSIPYGVPSYPKSSKGQLQLMLDHDIDLASAIDPPTIGNPPQNESDSLILRFYAKDAANNVSDTVNTGLIIILR
ncbi:MAG TPA: hypothetical protein VMI35_09705 [Puia sp.]|nr:hypothetical protein [Puia sp.]